MGLERCPNALDDLLAKKNRSIASSIHESASTVRLDPSVSNGAIAFAHNNRSEATRCGIDGGEHLSRVAVQ